MTKSGGVPGNAQAKAGKKTGRTGSLGTHRRRSVVSLSPPLVFVSQPPPATTRQAVRPRTSTPTCGPHIRTAWAELTVGATKGRVEDAVGDIKGVCQRDDVRAQMPTEVGHHPIHLCVAVQPAERTLGWQNPILFRLLHSIFCFGALPPQVHVQGNAANPPSPKKKNPALTQCGPERSKRRARAWRRRSFQHTRLSQRGARAQACRRKPSAEAYLRNLVSV